MRSARVDSYMNGSFGMFSLPKFESRDIAQYNVSTQYSVPVAIVAIRSSLSNAQHIDKVAECTATVTGSCIPKGVRAEISEKRCWVDGYPYQCTGSIDGFPICGT